MFIITKDFIEDTNRPAITEDQKKKMPHKFRLFDDDGELYFEGYSSNSSSFCPLDEYGIDYGCTEIKYFEKGKWEVL